jgi:hypothetical protein
MTGAARLVLSLTAVLLSLAAGDQGARPTSDAYDQSKMDLDPAPVKTVRLDTVHKIIEIAGSVKASAGGH